MSPHEHRHRSTRGEPLLSELDIVIAGPYPPPLGGVSSHVQRATRALQSAGYRVGVLNHFTSEVDNSPVIGTLRRSPLLYFLKLRNIRAPIVHYHHAGRLTLLFAVALARSRHGRWLVTVHNQSLTRCLDSSRFSGCLVRWAMGRFDQAIAVSPEIAQTLEDRDVDVPILVRPAYIRAALGESLGTDLWAPEDVVRRSGVDLIVSAYRVSRFGGDGDVYGLDIAVKVFAALARDGLDLRLAVFLAHPPRGRWARRYLGSTLGSVDPQLRPRLKLFVGQALGPAFDHRAVYLRPTRTDGDSVSVREALDAAVPVVASDVVSRPPGARALSIERLDLWRDAVAGEINRVRARARTPGMARVQPDSSGSHDEVVALYRSQLNRTSTTAP